METREMNPVCSSSATVQTRTISVKVVQIDNRQMTLSVFRQLPEVRWHRAVNYIPWGFVNYWPTKLVGRDKLFYNPVILECDETLYRCLWPNHEDTVLSYCRQFSIDYALDFVEELYPEIEWTVSAGEIYPKYTTILAEAAPDYKKHISSKRLEALEISRSMIQAFEATSLALDECGQLFIAT